MATISISILTLCGLGLIYMVVWVRPRIDKIYRLSMHVHDLTFRHGSNWQRKLYLNDRIGRHDNYEYSFKPIKLEAFFTKEEIELLNS